MLRCSAMMKRISVVLTVALLVTASAYAAQGTGSIAGVAQDAQKVVMSGIKVQLP